MTALITLSPPLGTRSTYLDSDPSRKRRQACGAENLCGQGADEATHRFLVGLEGGLKKAAGRADLSERQKRRGRGQGGMEAAAAATPRWTA